MIDFKSFLLDNLFLWLLLLISIGHGLNHDYDKANAALLAIVVGDIINKNIQRYRK